MKKYMIRCDMEGVSGIVGYEQADPAQTEYPDGVRWFMSDLNALINGLRAGGADEIHVYDEHFYGRNIDISQLDDPNVILYCGKPPYRPDWAGGLDGSFAGLILLGFHSRRGTKDALLNHTYEPDIRNLKLNGVSVGEIGMEAAIAGDFGVPLVMLTADSEGIREAKELVGDVRAVSVKESLAEFGAVCYPLKHTYEKIFETAKRTAEQGAESKVYACGKTTLEVEFFDTPFAAKYRELYKNTVIHGENVLSCWAEYWKRKLEVQKLL